MDALDARTRAVTWANDIVADPGIVYIDTETTGLESTAEIVDIAVVGADGAVLLDTLVRPQRAIPDDASRIHGIHDHHVANAPGWRDVYGLLVPLLAERRVVIFNVDYDRRIIHQRCREHRLDTIDGAAHWQCAMLAYAEFVGEPSRWDDGYRWHKLENAAKSFGVTPGGHRARADAEACRQVVHGMAAAV